MRITIDFARQGDATLAETARALLAAALADLDAGDEVTLQVHPPAEGYPALLILACAQLASGHAALRRSASECGALVSDLGARELLVRLQPAAEDKVQAVRDLEADGRNVLVAGGGADDAPALATVGIGAAMDRARSNQTLDTTNIVIMPPTWPPSCRYPGRNRAVAAHRPRDHRGPGDHATVIIAGPVSWDLAGHLPAPFGVPGPRGLHRHHRPQRPAAPARQDMGGEPRCPAGTLRRPRPGTAGTGLVLGRPAAGQASPARRAAAYAAFTAAESNVAVLSAERITPGRVLDVRAEARKIRALRGRGRIGRDMQHLAFRRRHQTLWAAPAARQVTTPVPGGTQRRGRSPGRR